MSPEKEEPQMVPLRMPSEIEHRIYMREQRLEELAIQVRNLPDTGPLLEVRQILERIVEELR